jgi:hypothetical protein
MLVQAGKREIPTAIQKSPANSCFVACVTKTSRFHSSFLGSGREIKMAPKHPLMCRHLGTHSWQLVGHQVITVMVRDLKFVKFYSSTETSAHFRISQEKRKARQLICSHATKCVRLGQTAAAAVGCALFKSFVSAPNVGKERHRPTVRPSCMGSNEPKNLAPTIVLIVSRANLSPRQVHLLIAGTAIS